MDSYRYLGVQQLNEEGTRKAARVKYLHNVGLVLTSHLNDKSMKNKVQAINTYALPVTRHPAGIIRWTKEETEATDIKTKKLLPMHGVQYPVSRKKEAED